MHTHPMFLNCFTAAVVSCLAGCSSLSPATALHLSRFDPLTADPAQLSVAILLPDSLKLNSGDIVMTIKQQAAARSSAMDATFRLAVTSPGPGTIGNVTAGSGQRLLLANITPLDVGRLRKLQGIIQQQEQQAAARGKGSISVAIQGGCRTRELGSAPLPASIYIKTELASPYYPLISNEDLRKRFGEAVISKVPECAA